MIDTKTSILVSDLTIPQIEEHFSGIMRDLMNDKSLERYFEQYEKLFESLQESNRHNIALVSKCRELNDEIVKNTQKVTDIIGVNKSDQIILVQLRKEFEKAWETVDRIQNKEIQSKNTISILKTEIGQFSEMISNSKSSLNGLEYSKQGLEHEIQKLKIEIHHNSEICSSLKNECESLKYSNKELFLLNEQLASEELSSKSELLCIDDNYNRIKDDKMIISNTIETNEKSIFSNEQEIFAINNQIKEKMSEIRNLSSTINSLNDVLEYENSQQKGILVNKKVLVDKLKQIRIKRKELDRKKLSMISSIDDNEIIKKGIHHRLVELHSIIKASEIEIQERSKNRVLLQRDKDIYIQKLNESRLRLNEMRKKDTKVHNSNIEAIKNQQTIYEHNKSLENAIKDLDNENAFQQIQTQKALNCTQQTLKEKMDDGSYISSLNTELDSLRTAVSKLLIDTYRINVIITGFENEKKNRELELNEINKSYSHMNQKLETEKSRVSNLLNSIANVQQENLLLEENIVKLHLISEEEKKKMIEDVIKISETHLLKLEINIKSSKHNDQKSQIEQQLRKCSNIINDLEMEYHQHIHLLSEACFQKNDVSNIISIIHKQVSSMSNVLMKKSIESKMLKEKSKFINNQIGIKNKLFNEKLQELDSMKNHLQALKGLHLELSIKVDKNKSLRKEVFRLEKLISMTHSRAAAIEEEMSNPIIIHRWTLLENTNPELLSLIKIKQAVTDDLLNSSLIIQRLNHIHGKLVRKKTNMEKQSKNPELGSQLIEEYHRLNDELIEKAKKCDDLNRTYQSSSSRLVETRFYITSAREQLSSIQSEIADSKSCESSTMDIVHPRPFNFRRKESLFLGGGYALGMFSSPEVHAPLSARIIRHQPPLLSPRSPKKINGIILTPRIKSTKI